MIEKIDFDDSFHRSIFGGKTFTLESRWDSQYYKTFDPINEYKLDEHGFRSKLSASDILIGGCSVTFGVGVPEEATWGRVVGKALDKSTALVAIPGMSIPSIVEQIFIYFRTYGHPEKVLCLFPDLGRMSVLADEVVLSGGKWGFHGDELSGKKDAHTVYIFHGHEEEQPNYIKKPYDIKHTTTYENAASLSIKSIRTLEQYCSAVGIDFIWSTWDMPFSLKMEQINKNIDFSFSNYFDVINSGCSFYRKENGIDKQIIFSSAIDYDSCVGRHRRVECGCGLLECHSELLDLYGPDNFYLGADTLRGKEFAHPGIHLQAHYAEAFLEQLKLKVSN